MATLVALTGVGQWWDEIDWWSESPIESTEERTGEEELRTLSVDSYLEQAGCKESKEM